MSNQNLTSIIIPCFNQAEFLGEALESAVRQSFPHCEVIVVDDGSTDGTAKVAAGFDRVRFLLQKNRGLAAARNTGLKASAGRFVVFLDADDRLLPDAVETGAALLDANPRCAFVYGHVRLIATDGSALPTPAQVAVESDHYAELLRHNYIWTAGAVVYRRTALESVGGFNSLIDASSDFDLNARLTRRFSVCCNDRVVLEYRRHNQSMSRNHARMLKAAVTARCLQRDFVRECDRYQTALASGIRDARQYYGEKLITQVREQIRDGRWIDAANGSAKLLRYYPKGLVRRARQKLQNLVLDAER